MFRKGQVDAGDVADYSLYFLFGSLFFGVLLVVLITLVVNINSQHTPMELQRTVHVGRFINNCFPYMDPEISRKYAGIIDHSRFTDERLRECYLVDADTGSFAYRLTLISENAQSSITTANFHSRYDRRTVVPVLIFKDNRFVQGELHVDFEAR